MMKASTVADRKALGNSSRYGAARISPMLDASEIALREDRFPIDLALANLEGDIVDRDMTRIALGQTFDFDHN